MLDSWLFIISYPLLKALHISFFTCWFAGLFYLPRLFVNLAMINEPATYQQLLTMAGKLYRFVTPFMFITIIFGVWMLIQNPSLLTMGWLHIKITLVAALIVYHFICGAHLKKFTRNQSTRKSIYFRWFNEFPVIILFSVVILAVTKWL